MNKAKFSIEQAEDIGKKIGIDFKKYSLKEFHQGINEELEHKDIIHDDPIKAGKIAFVHLKENKHYYSKLKKYVVNDNVYCLSEDKTAVIMRDGLYKYLAQEIGATELQPLTLVKVYRPPEEVKKAYNRFLEIKKLPTCAEHPDSFLDFKNENSFINGCGKNPTLKELHNISDNNLKVSLEMSCKLHLKNKTKQYYDEGIREISCGWEGDYIKADNPDYDYIQKFIDFNHIALVRKGRCGETCSIKDNIQGVENMDPKELEKLIDQKVQDSIKEKLEEKKEEIKEKLKEKKKDPKVEEDYDDIKDDDDDNIKDDDDDTTKSRKEKYLKLKEKYKNIKEKYCTKTKETKDALTIYDEKIAKAKIEIKDQFVKNMSDVLDVFSLGIIEVKDAKGKTPCEIKSMAVKKILDKDISTNDMSVLDAYFEVSLKNYSHPSWNKQVNDKNILDWKEESRLNFEKVASGEKLGGN